MDQPKQIETILIFAATFLVLGIGRLPGLKIDRTGASVIGAGFMLAIGALTIDEAWNAIHHDTIFLLFGMMILIANLRLSGFFTLAAQTIVRRAHHPITLLSTIVATTAIFSALFVNDTMCLVMTPLVLEITLTLRRNPLPYLIGVAVASNVGSVATITGNPQNMMIGSYSGLSYATFFFSLAPLAVIGSLLAIGLIVLLYRNEFKATGPLDIEPHDPEIDRLLIFKSIAASAVLFVAFFAGVPVAKAAMVAGALLLITRRIHPERIYEQIDWSLLVMFSGLFVVLEAVEKTSLNEHFLQLASSLRLQNVGVLSLLSAALSNLISNVPAVMVLKPVVQRLPDAKTGWLALAMSSTLAGNLTLLGSVANLIVVEQARKKVAISFWEYTRVGLPLTILTIAFGAWWLTL
ncbi:MAG: anion transporter [Acidobacteria bacterium]|nr:anion transporter [Acidobacteriota bacterium]